MGKLTKEQKNRYLKIFVAFLPLFIITFFLGFPFYFAVIFYLAAFLISIIFYFPNYLAIIGNINFIRGNEDAARKFLKAAIGKNTKSPVAHHNYGIILMRDGDGKYALDILKKALGLKPKTITEKKVYLAMGSCHWVIGDIPGAIKTLEGMMEKYEYVNAHVLSTLGFFYFCAGENEKALDFTNRALEDSPENASAWDNLGQIYFKQNEIAKAKEAFEKAVGFKPDLPDSNYHLGLIAEAEYDLSGAKKYFTDAHDGKITALNTVTKEQIKDKYEKYL